MLLSLVIPIYNEAGHLREFLSQLDAARFPIDVEFVFVDDCSKDSSLEILRSFSFQNPRVNILQQEKNQGKGAAVRRGFQEARGEFVVVQDADFEYDISEIPMLLEPLIKGKADVVYGSRFKKSGYQVHRTFHYLVNRFLTIVSNALSGLYLTDMETCYKLFRSEIIKNINLTSDRFGFEPEITAKLARLKVKVFEIPISYFPRSYMEGKKITWRDGVAALWHILYFNLVADKEDFFKTDLPQKYRVKGLQLL